MLCEYFNATIIWKINVTSQRWSIVIVQIWKQLIQTYFLVLTELGVDMGSRTHWVGSRHQVVLTGLALHMPFTSRDATNPPLLSFLRIQMRHPSPNYSHGLLWTVDVSLRTIYPVLAGFMILGACFVNALLNFHYTCWPFVPFQSSFGASCPQKGAASCWLILATADHSHVTWCQHSLARLCKEVAKSCWSVVPLVWWTIWKGRGNDRVFRKHSNSVMIVALHHRNAC